MGNTDSFTIHGQVSAGYEPVRDLFTQNFKRGLEKKAQVCAYVDGEKVVDLWGHTKDGSNYDGDSLAMVFSSTKSLTSVIFASLVDQGLINYDDKVSSVWPEFAQNNKENITFENVLRHESGLARVHLPIGPEDMLTENLKKNKIGQHIENSTQRFPNAEHGTDRQYHSISRGFILNEIFRRVDKKHRTVGEYLKEEISGPLGLDVYIGLRDPEKKKKIQELESWSPNYVYFHQLLPDMFGSKIESCTLGYLNGIYKTYKKARPRATLYWEESPISFSDFSIWSKDWAVQSEMPSSNGFCSARGLAKIASIMANGGETKDFKLMSKDTWEKMHGEKSIKKDVAQQLPGLSPTIMTRGGVAYFTPVDDHTPEDDKARQIREYRDGYYGWYGLGGAVFQWHPQHKVGFAYVPTLMAWYDNHNLRGAKLQRKVVECAENVLEQNKK